MSSGRIAVYGGRGALGSACVNYFRAANWWIANIDLKANPSADFNITVPSDASWTQQEEHVMTLLNTGLQDNKLDAVICVAGGWTGGNLCDNFSKKSDVMWRRSVWPSAIAASVATKHLCPGGLLALTGAIPALKGTPEMIGYGMAKAAVHQLTKSLGAENSGLPANAVAVALLPLALDTPMNRKLMPKADFTSWTPLSFVAQLLEKWISGQERPASGSLVALITEDCDTQVILSETEELRKRDVLTET
ncbi:dihydropteridine reductase-like [Helicoverpa zea]|uniref:dihydropteridine reductase-like n=1 Tax=Helicoverpa zea TaxID=7113 RepID=UPI001F58572E|nr:dihydropteridine reductase-like [Helicoverpa zea]